MEDEINLKDVVDVLVRRRGIIFWAVVFSVISAMIITLLTKPVYEGTSIVLVRSVSGSSYQFSGVASMMGINLGGSASSGSASDLFELLKTPAINKKVLSAVKEGFPSGPVDIGELKSKLNGNMLEISVLHKNPYMAAYISDAYVQALYYYWNKLNYTEAKKKKEYLEKQLPITEASLKAAEDKLKSLTYLVTQSKDFQQAPSQKTIDIVRLEREVEVQSSIYKMLRSEYESARVEEAKEVSPFSDVDKAEVPNKPVKPKPVLNLAIGFLFGLFAGVFLAFLTDYFKTAYKK